MPWPQTGATQYHAQTKIINIYRAIVPAKRSGPRLLTTVPWGINCITYVWNMKKLNKWRHKNILKIQRECTNDIIKKHDIIS